MTLVIDERKFEESILVFILHKLHNSVQQTPWLRPETNQSLKQHSGDVLAEFIFLRIAEILGKDGKERLTEEGSVGAGISKLVD